MITFQELNLSAPLLKAVEKLGFTTPSPIQAQALPLLLDGDTDFIGLAATGTGKTAAFSLPLLEKIDPNKKGLQALVMCPTRELAMQVADQINQFGQFKGLKALCIYGGAGYNDQIRGLKSGIQIVVGTPGRLIDHLERGTMKMDQVETIVLDEADEMISMGFKEDLEKVLASVQDQTRRIWLFSATMSPEIKRVANLYLKDYKLVQVNRTEVVPANVQQIYYVVKESDRAEVLKKIIDNEENFYGIIFCQTKALVNDLHTYLTSCGYKVDCLHGDKTQKDRERTMQAFRDKKVHVLVCTDVAARGLDVKEVGHVINYSVPRELDSYVHRIGRTARSGSSGVAISFVGPAGRGMISRLEKITNSKLIEGKIPTRKDIGEKKILNTLGDFKDQQTFTKAMELLSPEWKETLSEMSAEEIAGRFLALMSPEVFSNFEKERDLQAGFQAERGGRDDSRRRERSRGPSRNGGGGGGRGFSRRDGGARDEGSRAGVRRPYAGPKRSTEGAKRPAPVGAFRAQKTDTARPVARA